MLKAKSGNTFTNSESNYWVKQQISSTQNNLYYNNGNVGISTNIPLSLLHVNGNTSINYNTLAPTNGLIINGNIGVGTNIPMAKLDIENGNMTLTNNNPSGVASLYLYNDNANGLVLFINGSTRTADGSGNTVTLRNDAGTLRLQGASGNGITILSNGNVGINQSNPQTQLDISGNFIVPGSAIQVINKQYTGNTVYYLPNNNIISILKELNLIITPLKNNSKILLQWMINYECTNNTVFIVCRNGTPIGFNTNSGNVYYSGTAVAKYDADLFSTPSNNYVSFIDTPNTTQTITYSIGIKGSWISTVSTGTFSLNKPFGGLIQDTYENMISNGIAWEIGV